MKTSVIFVWITFSLSLISGVYCWCNSLVSFHQPGKIIIIIITIIIIIIIMRSLI